MKHSRNSVLVAIVLMLLLGISSCERSSETAAMENHSASKSSKDDQNRPRSSFPLPVPGSPSEFIYVSQEYLELLVRTKSQPAAVNQMEEPASPILFYQESDGKYGMSPNLHEGGQLVDLAEFSDEVDVGGKKFTKERVVDSVEKTLGQIILAKTLSKSSYAGDSMALTWSENKLEINGSTYTVKVETGGGYNELLQTMATADSGKADIPGYAFIEADGKLSLTPLEWEDDPVAVSAGSTKILE